MSQAQQRKLEQVLDLLLNEESDQAAEILHQLIVEKARVIYESIVEEEAEDDDVVGGEPDKDFTDEISSDEDEVSADEHNGGEASGEEADDDSDDDFGADAEGTTEERVDDLESQLAELRAEFDALMGEEMQEPEHADLAGIADGDDSMDDGVMAADMDDDTPSFGGEDTVVGEVVATMFEKAKAKKLEKAPEAKDKKKDKKVDEETQFLSKTPDTGQRGKAQLVGTGKDTPLGAEQDKSVFTKAPSKPSYGGTPANLLGSRATGGEYGKYNGMSAKSDTPSDNVNVKPKGNSTKADTTPKYTGGKAAGEGFNKSPFTKKPA